MVTAPLLHVGKYYFHTSFSWQVLGQHLVRTSRVQELVIVFRLPWRDQLKYSKWNNKIWHNACLGALIKVGINIKFLVLSIWRTVQLRLQPVRRIRLFKELSVTPLKAIKITISNLWVSKAPVKPIQSGACLLTCRRELWCWTNNCNICVQREWTNRRKTARWSTIHTSSCSWAILRKSLKNSAKNWHQ